MTDPLFFIEIAGLNTRGKWFLEADRDQSRTDVLDTIRDYNSQVLTVLEVFEDENSVRNVTEDMKLEAGITNDAPPPGGQDKIDWQRDRRLDELKHETSNGRSARRLNARVA
ncbi:hypothetical protein [uncultured Bradyrhizobium sp.]|uniref:hypothetical protein n=1 Tax=uncultured Bradyrhizobium sp. TaxID=199684 RepID=UPI0035CC2BBF